MSLANAFEPLQSALGRAGIRYAIGCSWASTAFGEPRFTNDVDLLAELTEQNVREFLAGLPEEFYVDEEEAVAAVQRGRPFNIIHIPLRRDIKGIIGACGMTLDRAYLMNGALKVGVQDLLKKHFLEFENEQTG